MRPFFAWIRRTASVAVDAASKPGFYRDVWDRRVTDAVGNVALLTLAFWVIPFAIVFFLGMRHGIAAVSEGLRTQVPAGASFELKDGRLSNDLEEPIVIRRDGFTVIVQSASGTAALADGEDGLVVSSTGVYQQEGGRSETMSFADAPDFSVDREELIARVARWAPFVLFVGSFLALCAVFGIFTIGFLFSAAFHAAVLWLALKMFRRPRPWKRAFVASAYALTGPLVLRAIVSLADRPALDELSNLLYWAVLAWIVYDLVKREPAVPGKDGRDGQTPKVVDLPDGGQGQAS